MTSPDLVPTLELLRKVLQQEMRQGYQNRSIMGSGIHAFFRARFDQIAYDEAGATTAESILAYLRRYEAARTVEERQAIVQVMLKRLDATFARLATSTQAPEAGQLSPASSQPAPAPARMREAPPPGSPGQDSASESGRTGPLQPVPPATSDDHLTIGPANDHASPPWRPEAATPQFDPHPDVSLVPAIPDSSGGPLHASEPSGADEKTAPADNLEMPVPMASTDVPVSLDAPAEEALQSNAQEKKRLEQLGITTLRSVLEYWPRDHYDYSAPVRINRMMPDMQTTLVGTLRSVEMGRTPNKHIQIVEARVADPTGVMSVTWFNQPYLLKSLKPRIGQEVAISGKVELAGGRLRLAPRDVEFPADDEDGTSTRRIVPIYPATEGIAQRWIRRLIQRALSLGAGRLPDPLPEPVRRQFGLLERRIAVAQYHFPSTMDARDRARNRLALDELLLIQLGMLQRKRQWQGEDEGRSITAEPNLLAHFRESLPFTLTGAQQRALDEILGDMGRPVPMSRLLQGDVGSGKTVVAAAALLTTARAGMQGTIMAPTEILAEQHARTLEALLTPHGVTVALLTGSVPKARRARIYLEALSGSVQVLVGTHALIQEEFKFANLGLAIVDEQHRFGVVQRAALKGKGYNPHLLVMTATPIPRTLTLTLYGDLDVSVIDERPPNRQPVETRWTVVERQAYDLVREQVREGRQAYIICPLVEESETLEARAAVAEAKRLQQEVFPDLRLDLLHGKMRAQDKDAVLGRFRDGEIDILVATSVVEVGIDVPNATAMVVQDAQRFGLSQLHQFRGRVGRGAAQSYCVLLAEANNPTARERLQALCATDDGFKLAETDLRLRGPGEFWGTRQSGLPALQVAQVTDMPTLELARRVAETILQDDPQLTQPRHSLLADSLRRFWDTAAEPS